ncbi:MAG: hypothetical protein H0Z40_10440 [Desulfotomaculum sp.]|nr:hypothetical protein [Desulfotomaculum sp.]
MKGPKNFSQAVERIREKEEAPVLNSDQLYFHKFKYVVIYIYPGYNVNK